MATLAARAGQSRFAPWLVDAGQDARAGAAIAIAASERMEFHAILAARGAILFRGFDLTSLAAFSDFVDAFTDGAPRFAYVGGASPRRLLANGALYSSTEYPPEIELALHNELSYSDIYPRLLFFLCVEPASVGGATTLGDSRAILRAIDPRVVDHFRALGITYVRNLSSDRGSGYSWQDAFETDDPHVAEAACRRAGADVAWIDRLMRISQRRPATLRHPGSGEELWFNQAEGFHPSALDAPTHAALLADRGTEDRFRLNVTFGDGSPIPAAALNRIRAATRAQKTEHVWQRGDVVVLDNILTAHGRAPFWGPRKIALTMI